MVVAQCLLQAGGPPTGPPAWGINRELYEALPNAHHHHFRGVGRPTATAALPRPPCARTRRPLVRIKAGILGPLSAQSPDATATCPRRCRHHVRTPEQQFHTLPPDVVMFSALAEGLQPGRLARTQGARGGNLGGPCSCVPALRLLAVAMLFHSLPAR